VNFLGHVHVALAAGCDDPEYVLGAALPDLAPMAGVRVARANLDGALGAGVRCHLRADVAFHAHPAFRAGSRALRHALADRGVVSGPARAVGHAGWELLLDGTLVGSGTEEVFQRAMTVGERASSAMAEEDRSRWTAFLRRARTPGGLRYDDPRWVADRLHSMLARRPRLRLPDDQVATVADVLARHVDAVLSAAPVVLDDTARASRADPGPPDAREDQARHSSSL
jgi:acyl carrier protein phosphodiesterase